MQLNFPRRGSERGVNIVIITGSCCMPGMAAFDEQARCVVQQAVSETGVEAQVKMMPATTAYFGGAPRQVMAELISLFQSRRLGVPAILINGEPVSYGVPAIEDFKSALLEVANTNTKISKEDKPDESTI